MQLIKHAIISAAGIGSRLGLNLPKCLVEINGRSLIDYQLQLLKEVQDVRIVVGFMENSVIQRVKMIRPDAIFVRNPEYLHTSNSYSLHLASKDLKDPFLIMDGDLLIGVNSFKTFLNTIKQDQTLVGITKAKTEEAVFVELNTQNQIINFTRDKKQEFEWSGLAYVAGLEINKNDKFVYQELAKGLPLKAAQIDCYEIDTQTDLNQARHNAFKLGYIF